MSASAVLASGWWSHHGAHALVLGIPVMIIGGVAVWADVRAFISRRRERGHPTGVDTTYRSA